MRLISSITVRKKAKWFPKLLNHSGGAVFLGFVLKEQFNTSRQILSIVYENNTRCNKPQHVLKEKNPSAGENDHLTPLTEFFNCRINRILSLNLRFKTSFFLTVHNVMAEAQHSTGPDNRWALLFTLYPICSIMTQRKGVTEGGEEEWGELCEKCKSRTVGCEFMTTAEAYSVIPALLLNWFLWWSS